MAGTDVCAVAGAEDTVPFVLVKLIELDLRVIVGNQLLESLGRVKVVRVGFGSGNDAGAEACD